MNIIVTGASTGIGFEVVKALSGQQEHHIIAIARDHKKLEALRILCEKEHGQRIEIYAGDISKATFAADFTDFLRSQGKQVNILLNNAGQLINKPFSETSREDFIYLYNVNVFGVAELTRKLLPFFDRQMAHVVNIGSMGGFQGSAKFPGLSLYSSTKAALANLTECLAEEYKEEGIRFNCLCLGSVQTAMLSQAFPGFKAPLGAGEMAGFIVDFCLRGGLFFNGKVLPVSISTP